MSNIFGSRINTADTNYLTEGRARGMFVDELGDDIRGTIDMKNNKIINLGNPINKSDGINKEYIDNKINPLLLHFKNLYKNPMNLASLVSTNNNNKQIEINKMFDDNLNTFWTTTEPNTYNEINISFPFVISLLEVKLSHKVGVNYNRAINVRLFQSDKEQVKLLTEYDKNINIIDGIEYSLKCNVSLQHLIIQLHSSNTLIGIYNLQLNYE